MYTETIQKQPSVAIGICATTELANTITLTKNMLDTRHTGMNLTEVIVATPNYQLAKRLQHGDPRLTVLFETKREGKAAALNRIVKHASADILVLASADIRLIDDSISKLVAGLAENQQWGAVDSKVELDNKDEVLMDRVSNLLWDIHNATLEHLDGRDRLGHVAGDLLAVRRGILNLVPSIINDDSYIAMQVQEKGLLVKRIQEARVWIIGPRTPTDYVQQRSRVLSGHLQMIALLGKIPGTFEFQVLTSPRHTLRILVKAISKRGPSRLVNFCVAGILEFLSFNLALALMITGRAKRPWPIVKTTKPD